MDRSLASGPLITSDAVGLRKATARAWLQAGEPSRAREMLKSGGKSRDDPETAYLLSRSYLQEHSLAAAEQFIEASQQYRAAHPLEPRPATLRGLGPSASAMRRSPTHSVPAGTPGCFSARPSLPFDRFRTSPLPTRASRPCNTRSAIGRELRYVTRSGDAVAIAVLAYAFGSGERGATLVGRDDRGRHFREMRLSLYENQSVWDVTAGQTSPPSGSSDQLGHILTDDELRAAFFVTRR